MLFTISLSLSTTGSAQTLELSANDLASYLRVNEKVVVLFTSPDRSCGFCNGAEETFVQAVQQLSTSNRDLSEWRYVTVHWQPWRALPPQVSALGVSGVPARGAFVKGKPVGWADGRELSIEHLAQGLLAAQSGQKWSPLPEESQPKSAAAFQEKRLTKEELDKALSPEGMMQPLKAAWVETQGQRAFLLALHKDCAARYPNRSSAFRHSLSAWSKKAWPVIMDIRQVGWLERDEGVRAAADEEKRFSRGMQIKTGLTFPGVLDEPGCVRLLDASVTEPLPKYLGASELAR